MFMFLNLFRQQENWWEYRVEGFSWDSRSYTKGYEFGAVKWLNAINARLYKR